MAALWFVLAGVLSPETSLPQGIAVVVVVSVVLQIWTKLKGLADYLSDKLSAKVDNLLIGRLRDKAGDRFSDDDEVTVDDAVEVLDASGDGKLDLVTASSSTGLVSWAPGL